MSNTEQLISARLENSYDRPDCCLEGHAVRPNYLQVAATLDARNLSQVPSRIQERRVSSKVDYAADINMHTGASQVQYQGNLTLTFA